LFALEALKSTADSRDWGLSRERTAILPLDRGQKMIFCPTFIQGSSSWCIHRELLLPSPNIYLETIFTVL